MKKIGIFGGTFDPFTEAHAAIVNKVLDEKLVDEVVIVPTVVDYYRDKEDKWLSYSERVNVIAKMMGGKIIQGDVKICLAEYDFLDGKCKREQEAFCASRRFIHTLINLRFELFAETDLYTIIGTDQYRNFKKWFMWEEILKLTKLIVVNGRNGETVAIDEAVPCQFVTIDDKYDEVSATKIRREYKGTPDAVSRYINNLPPMKDRVLQHTPIFDLVEKDVVQPGFRPVGINSPDWVSIFAEKGGKVLCVKQLRYGLMQECEELPCGMVEKVEIPLCAVIRELFEETGYRIRNLRDVVYLGKYAANPAFMNNYMHYFYVNLDNVTYDKEEPKPDEHEKLQVYWKDKKQFAEDFETSCGSAIMAAMLYKISNFSSIVNRRS